MNAVLHFFSAYFFISLKYVTEKERGKKWYALPSTILNKSLPPESVQLKQRHAQRENFMFEQIHAISIGLVLSSAC